AFMFVSFGMSILSRKGAGQFEARLGSSTSGKIASTSSLRKVLPSSALGISGLSPQAGERIAWGFGGCGASYTALEVGVGARVVQSRSSSQTRGHIITGRCAESSRVEAGCRTLRGLKLSRSVLIVASQLAPSK